MTEKIKKCPFCGRELVRTTNTYKNSQDEEVMEDFYSHDVTAYSEYCTAEEIIIGNNTKDITAWNTRAADENPEPTTEELIEFINDPDARQEQHEYAMYLLAKRMKDENPPLTIEELKEISKDIENRQWVWIEILPEYTRHKPYSEAESAYYHVQTDYAKGESFCCGYPGYGFEFEYEDYGKTWLAYRRKPEE
ncbi:hypothetical protein [Sedimentibacter sp.]|uniref:hypothetical protein n=1 Tax=Sedimentibacter sp. TaxID=1960295 RepID=UPI0028AD3D0B|nr:hypothetical protein [Sedimentibacter sp.]